MTFQSPLSREVLLRLQEHESFFAWLRDAKDRDPALRPRLAAADAVTEREVIPDREIRVSLVTPIDDNSNPADGRIYLKDTFTYDIVERRLKNYSFEWSGKALPEVWEKVQRWRNAAPLDLQSPEVQAFARDVIAFHGRPLKSFVYRALKTQQAYLQKGYDEMRRLQPGWTIKFKDPQTHFRVAKKEDDLLIEFNFVMDDDADPANGRMFWVEQFTVDPISGKMKSHHRDWRPARELSGELKKSHGEWEEALQKIPMHGVEEAQAFIQALLPDVLHKVPTYWNLPFEGITGRWAQEDRRSRRGTLEGLEILKAHWLERLPRMQSEAKGWWSRLKTAWKADEGSNELKPEALEALFQKAQALVRAEGGEGPLEAFSRLELNRGEKAWAKALESDRVSQWIDAASQEIAGLRANQMLHVAREVFMEGGDFRSAAFLLGQMEKNDKIQAMPEVRAEIGRLQKLMKGRGTVGSLLEHRLPRFGEQIAEFAPFMAMMAAPVVGMVGESLLLAGIGRSLAGSAVAFGTGITLEAATFAAAKDFFASFTQDPAELWSWKRWVEETAALLPFFSLTRFAQGGVSAFAVGGGAGIGRRGRGARARDWDWEFPVGPTGRVLTLDRPTLSRNGRNLIAGLHPLAGLGAVLGADAISRSGKWWSPDSGDPSDGGGAFNFLVMYAQAVFGARLSNGLLHGRPAAFLAEVQLRSGAASATQDGIARLFREDGPPASQLPRSVRPYREALRELYGPEKVLEVGGQFSSLFGKFPKIKTVFTPDRLRVENAGEQMAVFDAARVFLEKANPFLPGQSVTDALETIQSIQTARRMFSNPTLEQVEAVLQRDGETLQTLFGNEAEQGAVHFAGLFRNFSALLTAGSPESSSFSPERLAAATPGEYLELWTQAMASQPSRLTEEMVRLEAQRVVEALTILAEKNPSLTEAPRASLEA
jgi:hypothetical protein